MASSSLKRKSSVSSGGVQKSMRRESPTESVVEMDQLVESELRDQWVSHMDRSQRSWFPQPHHRCGSCSVVNPLVRVYQRLDGASSSAATYHVCSTYCTARDAHPEHHKTCVQVIRDLYVCEATGRVHRCDSRCREPKCMGPLGNFVCPISGIMSGSGYVLTHRDDVDSDKSGRVGATKAAVQSIAANISDETIRRGNAKSLRYPTLILMQDQCFLLACKIIDSILFSSAREKRERELEAKAEASAYHAISRYCKDVQKRDPPVAPVAMTAFQIYLDMTRRKEQFPRIIAHPRVKQRLIEYFAWVCLDLFDVLTRIPIPSSILDAKHHLRLVHFKYFVYATLSLLRESKVIDNVVCVPQDLLIAKRFPTTNRINEHYGNPEKTQYTRMCNRIDQLFRTLYTNNLATLDQLSVTTLDREEDLIRSKTPVAELYGHAKIEWGKRVGVDVNFYY